MPGPETFVGQRRSGAVRRAAPAAPGPCLPDAGRRLGGRGGARRHAGALVGRVPPRSPGPETALTTLVTRLAMDRMRLIRAARQGYSGSGSRSHCPVARATASPCPWSCLPPWSVSPRWNGPPTCCCVVLARPYPEVADVLGRRLPAVRQLVRRAQGPPRRRRDAGRGQPNPVTRSMDPPPARCGLPVGVARCPRRRPGAGRRPAERRGPKRAGPSGARRRPRPRGTVSPSPS